MQVVNNFQDLHEVYADCVVALGTFDGIHLGHLDIIKIAKQEAQKAGKKVVVFSFSNHPLEQIAPEKTPSRLCTEEQKIALLTELGIDILFNMHFDDKVASVTSEQFIVDLKNFFSPICIVIGDNYSYGYLGAGTPKTLLEDGKKYNFSVIVRDLVKNDDIVVSSTNIRNLIIEGNIDLANNLLGRQYSLTGQVIHGDKRGRTLGFPTANLKIIPDNMTIPANGVYMAWVIVKGVTYKSVVSIGFNPTFKVKEKRIEVHILQFDKNIYDTNITVLFVKKIRDEKKFSNIEELVKNIDNDVVLANKCLSNK